MTSIALLMMKTSPIQTTIALLMIQTNPIMMITIASMKKYLPTTTDNHGCVHEDRLNSKRSLDLEKGSPSQTLNKLKPLIHIFFFFAHIVSMYIIHKADSIKYE